MAFLPGLLFRLLQALYRGLLRIYKPQLIGRALIWILRLFFPVEDLFRSKLRPSTEGNDTARTKSEPRSTKDRPEDASSNQIRFTTIRHGDSISLESVSLSLYPFSSSGIRSPTRSSMQRERFRSRSQSGSRRSSRHTEFNDSHSVDGFIYDLPLHPIQPPSRNPRRQLSISMPDLHSYSTQNSLPILPRSTTSDADMEIASPVGLQSDGNIHERYKPGRSQRTSTDSNESSSSLHSIAVEQEQPLPPILERNLPEHISEINLHSSRDTIFLDGPTLRPVVPDATLRYSRRTRALKKFKNMQIDELTTVFDRPATPDRKIKCVLPDNTLRYTRRTRALKKFKNMQIDELTTVFDRPAAPSGWRRFAHPEGACYYYHAEKRVYTDSHLSDPEILDRIMDDITRLERLRDTFDQPFPKNAVLMIDINRLEDGDLETSYYYADHDERAIFYLHAIDTWDIDAAWEVEGVKSYRHLGYEMQGQYWYFVSLYPDSCSLTTAMLCELRDIVLYVIGDIMTSPYPTSPYTSEDLFKILNSLGEIEKNAQPGYPGCMAVFARHMYIFCHTRFLNCHGESFARIEHNFSVFGDPLHKRTLFIRSLSCILFFAPNAHLRALQKIWVDGIMHKSVWDQNMKSLNDEWKEFVVFATVMLTSNVGFLAIQSVDINENPFRSATQILSYVSSVANIGALIMGLLLIKQDPEKRRETAEDVQVFLMKRNHPQLGLENLAILYSLPYALLMWGILAFLGAFGCLIFQDSNIQTRSIVGSLSLVVLTLIFWCIITLWVNRDHSGEIERPLAYEERSSESTIPNYTIFDKIRHLPVLQYIRRKLPIPPQTVPV